MNLNALMTARDKAGLRVEDLQNKKTELAIKMTNDPDSVTDKEITELSNSLDSARKARDLAQSALDEARANNKEENLKPIEVTNTDKKSTNVISGFRDMLRNPMKYMDMSTSSKEDDSSAGLAIPVDQQTEINTLTRQYDDLRDLVTVEPVSTDSGTRNVEKFSEITPMEQLDDIPDDASQKKDYAWQDKDIPEGDYPALRQIHYQVHDYGDIFYAPNDLLNDSDQNIQQWLNQHIARKQVVTYNSKINALLPESQIKATITKLDDMLTTIGDLDMALWSGATLLLNKSGYMELAKVRLGTGERAMKVDPRTGITMFNMDGTQYAVKIVEDRWLPDNTNKSGSSKSHPFYFGNFKEYLHLFDRQQPSLLTSNIADKAFRRNQTAIRSLLRFDLKIWDDEAMVSGSFDHVEDQPLLFSSAQPNTADAGK